MALTEKELPVLNEVIRAGNASIIRSTRSRQIDFVEPAPNDRDQIRFDLPLHLQIDIPDPDTHVEPPIVDDELESLIDDIVDRHIEALRRDLRIVLERAQELS